MLKNKNNAIISGTQFSFRKGELYMGARVLYRVILLLYFTIIVIIILKSILI